jgi:ABC-2 type transport system permease protein
VAGLLGAEWLKLRKRWMPRILLSILIVICALIFWGLGSSHNRSDLYFPRGLLVASVICTSVGTFLWPILAASWAGNEYGWGTIRMILSRRPNRIEYLAASLGVLVIAAGLALLAVLVVELVAALIVAAATGQTFVQTSGLASNFAGDVVKDYLASWYTMAFFVVLSYAAATVFRSGGVGIGIGIGFTVGQIIISGIFAALGGAWKTIEEHLPHAYLDLPAAIAHPYLRTNFETQAGSGLPGIGGSIVGLTVYVVTLLVVTIVFLTRRDVTD